MYIYIQTERKRNELILAETPLQDLREAPKKNKKKTKNFCTEIDYYSIRQVRTNAYKTLSNLLLNLAF